MMCNKESMLNYIPAYPNTIVATLLIFLEEGPMKANMLQCEVTVSLAPLPLLSVCWIFSLMDFSLPRHHLFLPNLSLYWPFPQHISHFLILKISPNEVWVYHGVTLQRETSVLSWTHLVRSSGSLWFLESRLTAVWLFPSGVHPLGSSYLLDFT